MIALALVALLVLFVLPIAVAHRAVSLGLRGQSISWVLPVLGMVVQLALAGAYQRVYSSLPGDHFYVDRSVCLKPSSSQWHWMLAIIGAELLLAGVTTALAAAGRWPGGRAVALGPGVVAVLTPAVLVLVTIAVGICDPS